jgi:hypothetical protein
MRPPTTLAGQDQGPQIGADGRIEGGVGRGADSLGDQHHVHPLLERAEKIRDGLLIQGRETALRQHQVVAHFGLGPVQRVGETGLPHEQVGRQGKRARGDPRDQDEGDGQTPSEAAGANVAAGHGLKPVPADTRRPGPS